MKKLIVVLVVLVVLACTTFCTYAQGLGGLGFELQSENIIAQGIYEDASIAPQTTFWLEPPFETPEVGAFVEIILSSSSNDEYQGIDYLVTIGCECYESSYTNDKFTMSYREVSFNSLTGEVAYTFFVKPLLDDPYPYNFCRFFVVNADSSLYRDMTIRYSVYSVEFDTSEIRNNSYNRGFQVGYNDGLADGQTTSQSLDGFLVDIFAALATFFEPLMSLEIWGVNVLSILSLVVVATIAVIIMRLKK